MKMFIKYSAAVLLIIFMLIIVGSLSMNMKTDHNGHGKSCLMVMDGELVCTMNPIQHLSIWKRMITAVTPLIILSVAIFSTIIYGLWLEWSIIQEQSKFLSHESTRRRKRNRLLQLFDYLLQALASGILHPKLYQA